MIKIPHATRMYEVWQPPMVVLHVVTDVPQNPTSAGFDPLKKEELLRAARRLVCEGGAYDRLIVHAPDQP